MSLETSFSVTHSPTLASRLTESELALLDSTATALERFLELVSDPKVTDPIAEFRAELVQKFEEKQARAFEMSQNSTYSIARYAVVRKYEEAIGEVRNLLSHVETIHVLYKDLPAWAKEH